MVFDISVDIRKDDTDLLHCVDAVLRSRQPQIEALLRRYDVPLVAR